MQQNTIDTMITHASCVDQPRHATSAFAFYMIDTRITHASHGGSAHTCNKCICLVWLSCTES